MGSGSLAVRSRRLVLLVACVLTLSLLPVGAPFLARYAAAAEADVPTNSADNLRTGWYPRQNTLTPDLVTGGTFGQMFSATVDGQVYAQPITAGGRLLVATERNQAYGLDPKTGSEIWHQDLNAGVGAPFNPADVSCGDLVPSIGVTGTPVVDPATNTQYLFTKNYASGTSGAVIWRMHALDVATGAERAGFPVVISGTASNSTRTFNAANELQRPGLLLLDGWVYAGFGGHCDHGDYTGWVVGVSTNGQAKTLWAALTSGNGAGIWQSGGGLVSDGPGTIILTTGNGATPTTPVPGSSPPGMLGQAVVRLKVQADHTLKATDFFMPYDAPALNTWDADLGSSSPVALPPFFGAGTAHPRLIVQSGKEGYVYLLDRDSLGGYQQGANGGDAVVQRIGQFGGVWGKAAAWSGDGGYVYMATASGGTTAGATAGQLNAFKYGVDGSGKPGLTRVASSSDAFGLSSSPPVVSSNGTTSGTAVVWVVYAPNGTGVGAQLRAYRPVPVNGQMVMLGSWPVGTAAKFNPPLVDGDRVYVATRDGKVLCFGSPVTVPLSGTPVSFDPTAVGQSATTVATLTAQGALQVTGVSTVGAAFSASAPSLPVQLQQGDTISVPVTFSPTSVGPAGGSLVVTTSIGTTQVSLSGEGLSQTALLQTNPTAVSLGGVAVGQSRTSGAVLTNNGAQPLRFTAVTSPTAPFTVSGLPAVGSTLAAGASIQVTVTFAPTQTGTFTDELTVATDTGGTVTLPMSGSASPPPRLTITPLANTYPTTPVGATSARTFTVRNEGGTTLTITRSKPPVLTGSGFRAVSTLPEGSMIAPGGSVDLTVTFSPTTQGMKSDTWSINGDTAAPRAPSPSPATARRGPSCPRPRRQAGHGTAPRRSTATAPSCSPPRRSGPRPGRPSGARRSAPPTST